MSFQARYDRAECADTVHSAASTVAAAGTANLCSTTLVGPCQPVTATTAVAVGRFGTAGCMSLAHCQQPLTLRVARDSPGCCQGVSTLSGSSSCQLGWKKRTWRWRCKCGCDCTADNHRGASGVHAQHGDMREWRTGSTVNVQRCVWCVW